MLIQIVILNLTEVPVIGVKYLKEHVCVAVVGKTDIMDAAFCFFTFDPVFNPQSL